MTTTNKSAKKLALEIRIAKLSTNPAVNANLIKKAERALRKLSN